MLTHHLAHAGYGAVALAIGLESMGIPFPGEATMLAALAIAAPDAIHWAPALPKTRSGKIMRRILRKIAANETDALGDISTLADPTVVTDLVESRIR